MRVHRYSKQSLYKSRKFDRTMAAKFGQFKKSCSQIGRLIVKTSKGIVEEQKVLELQRIEEEKERRLTQQRATEEQIMLMIKQRNINFY
jgi:hypothetical protein